MKYLWGVATRMTRLDFQNLEMGIETTSQSNSDATHSCYEPTPNFLTNKKVLRWTLLVYPPVVKRVKLENPNGSEVLWDNQL